MKIENWAVVSPVSDPYAPPETLKLSLQGRVFGHPKFVDGHRITTSSIVGKNSKNEILTYSGSSYELGRVNPLYEKKFPDAKNRFLNNFKQQEAICECNCHWGGFENGQVCKQPCDECNCPR